MKRFAVGTVLMLVLLTVAPAARADDSGGGPGDGFQSVSLSAVAGGQRILADTLAGQAPGTVDSGIPDAEAQMTSSTGHALASIAWPSALAGNAGSLLFLLGPSPCTPALPQLFPGEPQPPPMCSPVPLPDDVLAQYHYLNSPIRAEAVYPVTPNANNSVPGGTMIAKANGIEASADAILGAALVSDIEQASSARATSSVRYTGPSAAVADAFSTISGISFASGAIKIGAVSSVAHGETNGNNAVSSGMTTVSDVTINGTPVTVDSGGVHVSGQAADAVGPATDGVNQVLAGFGAKLFVTPATQQNANGTSTFDAGSLVITWFPPGAPGGVVFEFGGAHVTAGATLPFQVDVGGLDINAGNGGAGAGSTALPSLTATGAPASTPSPSIGVPATPLQAGSASETRKLPGGINGWWILVAIVAVIAGGAALRQLPEQVLTAASPQCPTGED